MPTVNAPIGMEHHSTGMGTAASFDWGFPITNRLTAGPSLAGGFASFPVEETDPFNIFEGMIGVFTQWRINDRFSLRADVNAGVYQFNWQDKSGSLFLAGGGLSAQYHLTPFLSLFADAGFYWRPYSSRQDFNSFRSGIGVQINLSELLRPQSRLNGERTEQFNVFPVSFAWYEHNALAMFQITNEEPNTIRDVRLSFLLERFMNQPWQFTLIESLAPGETVSIPVTALFNESMLELNETVNASAQIIAEYRSLGITKTNVFHTQMPIFSRNSMTWDDTRRAASFVSPRDPAAVFFARYVRTAVENITAPDIPPNVRIAAALFEALRLFGISYIVDPASSFIALSANAYALDTLNYPYETLLFRGGDCDDLSILFAALLEALGIKTAFITIPGHIYAAFEIGDNAWRRGHADVIEIDGNRWLPVEITVPDRGFSEAVRIGARQWRTAAGEAALYPMRQSWEIFPPVTVITAGDNLPPMPERNAILRALEIELNRLR